VGAVYRRGEVPPWTPTTPPSDWWERTGSLPEITAGMSLTREIMRFNPSQQRDNLQMLGRILMVTGILSIVLVCAGLGAYLASTMFCPCTFGGSP